MGIFKNKDTLEHSFVPEKLPTREAYRRDLVEYIAKIFSVGSSIYRGILIYGSYGTGKTVLSKRASYDLKNRFLDLLPIYVNCRIHKRVYKVLSEIVKQISPDLPQRGLARDEFLELIFITASQRADKVLLILDELDSLFWGNEGKHANDFLYSLSRFIEDGKDRIGLLKFVVVGISRSDEFLYKWLDEATRRSFVQKKIRLPRYGSRELQEILSYRAELALVDGAISSDHIMFIADFVAEHVQGNARTAIDILRRAAELAELAGRTTIKVQDIRTAMEEESIDTFIDEEVLLGLGRQKLLLLLAIIRALKYSDKPYVTRREVYEVYKEVCEEYQESPRKNTQVWRYLREINYDLGGAISIKVSGKNQRGRSTRISVIVPLEGLEKAVLEVLKKLERQYQDY